MTTPSASSTSAAPEDDDAARPPCLATGTPAAAVTTAAIVEMLTVCAPSPPVPTMSTQSSGELHRRRLGEHLRGQAGDLLGRLALGAQRDGERGDLDRAWPRRS